MIASAKPYFLRALYEWCVDHGFTPHIIVHVDARTKVPPQYVEDGRIVLNLGPQAVHALHMGNDLITCQARFGGVAHALSIPVACVAALYARENGQGMAFEVEEAAGDGASPSPGSGSDTPPSGPPPRPHLTRIK